RERVRAVTSNWPWLLRQFHDRCRADGSGWEEHLRGLEADLRAPDPAGKMARALGLGCAEPVRGLRELAPCGELAQADLADLLGADVAPEQLERCLRWADWLRVATPTGSGWRIDPLAAQALQAPGG